MPNSKGQANGRIFWSGALEFAAVVAQRNEFSNPCPMFFDIDLSKTEFSCAQ